MASLKRPPTLGQEKQSHECILESERCPMPPERWQMSFGNLLTDRDRVVAFRQYLTNIQDHKGAKCMSMWLMLNGLDQKFHDKRAQIEARQENPKKLIDWIIKASDQLLDKVFCDGSTEFQAQQIRHYSAILKNDRNPQNADYLKRAFDASQAELKSFMENNQYKKYIQSETPGQYNTESDVEACMDDSRYLPTLHENSILPPNAELTSTNLDRSISQRSATNQSRFDNPYHSTRQYYVPTASHNDSEHHSQSSDCTSDSISFTDTSDGCMDDPRRKSKIEKRNRRRMISNNLDKFGNFSNFDRAVQVTDPSDTEMATKQPAKFHKVLCARLEDAILQMQKKEIENEDDAILTNHIAKNMGQSPTTGTPRNGQSKIRSQQLSSLVSNNHAQNNASLSKQKLGTLPTSSSSGRVPNTQASTSDVSQDVNLKVGAWLENTSSLTHGHRSGDSASRSKSRRSQPTVKTPQYNYQSNGFRAHQNQSLNRPPTFNPSTLSLDSGLSSTRIEGDTEAAELKGIKDRLIQETEGPVHTKLLYHFNNEKFVIRVPGRPPILSAFRQKFHQKLGKFQFFFKSEESTWIEITDINEPLPVIDDIVEARVMDANV